MGGAGNERGRVGEEGGSEEAVVGCWGGGGGGENLESEGKLKGKARGRIGERVKNGDKGKSE